MRKSSIHFEQVKNATTSILHSERGEDKEPAYLLPKEFRLGNAVVPGSMSNIAIGLEFTKAKESMTGQAKARGSSPFWEGVIVLDGTDLKAQTAQLQSWKKEYEKLTGQKVLHIAIHRDEGFVNTEGKPEYNIHAHVIVNRLNDKGRVIKLERKQLSAVQDLTAKSLGMQRGETLEDRNFMRGRKHLNHREFKAQANQKRLDAEHNIGAIQKEKSRTDHIRGLFQGDTKIIGDLKAQIEADYKANRAAMVASKTAMQADYKALKEAKDKEIADLTNELKSTKEQVVKMDEYSKNLEAAVVAGEAKLAAELVARAQAIEALVEAGEKSKALLVTSEGHREAAAKLLVRHEAFKVKAQAKIGEIIGAANEKIGGLESDLAAANALVESFKQARISEPNLPAPKEVLQAVDKILVEQAKERIRTASTPDPAPRPTEATKTTLEAPKQVQGGIPSPTPAKTPREAFLELYGHMKTVLVGLIDGMRLDEAEGRLGLFSAHSRTGPRVQVLCEVPEDKVMPAIGQVFDSRAVPGKGGLGD